MADSNVQFVSRTIRCVEPEPGAIPCTVYSRSVRKMLPRQFKPLLDGGPLSPAYEIKDAPGKGRGLFARRDIQMGEAIVVERPMLVFPNMLHVTHLDDEEQEAALMQLLRKLSTEDISRLLTLKNCRAGFPYLVGILYTNAIVISLPGGSPGDHAGLFPIISMINHSCGPNSVWKWNHASFSLILYAVGFIRQGAEICSTYVSIDIPRRDRQQALERKYRFRCTCTHCIRPETRRLELVQGRYESLTYSDWLLNPERSDGELIKSLLEDLEIATEEGLQCVFSWTYYTQLSMCYGALGKEKEMKEWGFRSILAMLHLDFPPDYPYIGRWIDWVTDPPRFFPEWKMAVKGKVR